jgi:hypothetical protein
VSEQPQQTGSDELGTGGWEHAPHEPFNHLTQAITSIYRSTGGESVEKETSGRQDGSNSEGSVIMCNNRLVSWFTATVSSLMESQCCAGVSASWTAMATRVRMGRDNKNQKCRIHKPSPSMIARIKLETFFTYSQHGHVDYSANCRCTAFTIPPLAMYGR